MKHISQLEHKIYKEAQGNEIMSDMVERKHQEELVNHFHMTRRHAINKVNESFITTQKQDIHGFAAFLKVIMFCHWETL